MQEQVEKGKFVSFHFQMYTSTGECIGSSEGQPPLTYIHGETVIEPIGLMEYLEGKQQGHVGEVSLPPEKAYGEQLLPPKESADRLPQSAFGDMEITPGMMLMANIPGKGELPITIMDIMGDEVLVYYGHPLAGQTLSFEVSVIEVRDATAEDRTELGVPE
jgi:FKBP-type peptidyl-prolyl cis-trans isomerase SlyD